MDDKKVINLKCYNCGTEFKTKQILDRHKNKKTPCLIREVAPENLHNPNRCIYCNKIFSKKENLTRHLKICKIKNGGMNILDDKVRHEYEIRILKEENLKMQGLVQELCKKVEKIEKMSNDNIINNNCNNTTNNINCTTNNFNFYNYDNPYLDTLIFHADDFLVDNIAKKLLELIYFNKDIPSNHIVYLPNIKETRIMLYKDGTWQNIEKEGLMEVFTTLKNKVYLIGLNKINKEVYASDAEFEALYPSVKAAIISFNSGGDHAKMSDKEILNVIWCKRNVVSDTLKMKKII